MKSLNTTGINNRCGKFAAFFFLVLLSVVARAQNGTVSLYSRYGIGDLNFSGYARNLAMGGIQTGLNQANYINAGNPAALANCFFTVFEAGANFEEAQLQTSSTSQYSNAAALSYFDMAFPIKPEKWTLGFGLRPYSKVGYSVKESLTTPFGDDQYNTFKGSGGVNNFHLGTGFRIAKNLNAGASAEFLFGVINQDRTVEFHSSYYMSTLDKQSTSIGWFHYTFGLQYTMDSLRLSPSDSIVEIDRRIMLLNDSIQKIIRRDTGRTSTLYAELNAMKQQLAAAKAEKKSVVNRKKKGDWQLCFGLSASPDASLRTHYSNVASSFRYVNVAEETYYIRDTVIYSPSTEGKIKLPMSASFGVCLRNTGHWLIGADYSIQQWSNFETNGVKDSLNDSWRVSLGAQFTPGETARSLTYRLGGHYEQTYFNFNGYKINETGISFGMGIPVKKAGTNLHLSFELGSRGTVEHNLIKENYLRFTLGLTINDKWFIKPKYD